MPRKEVLGRRPNHHNLKNRFELVRTLGQGTYGKVQLAIEKSSGIQYAIKTIKKQKIGNEHDKTRIHREIELMTHLSHPHITSVYEVFENSEKIVLVMEYASGGELYDYINDKQGLYEEEARKFFRQIASAAYYLHMNGIVHRDLKLENIVLDKKGNAMLADFGLANIYSKDELLSTYCGSPLYASPEIVNGLPYTGPEVDCWSLGVLLFTLVYGAMPFDGSDFRKLRNQITAGNYYEPEPSSDAAGLIRFILTPNPAKRATIHDICDHWWTNVGYEHNPVEETRPGKPVNFSALKKLLSDGYHSSDSEGDSPKKKPIKGILKKPKSKQEAKQYTSEVDTGACGDQLHSNDTKDLVSNKEKTSKQKSSVSNGHDRYTNKGKGSMGKTTRSKEPKKGILKHTKMPCQAASDSGCVVDENVCECADIQKQISAASLDSGVGGNSKTNVNCAQSTDELCEKCVDKKGNHIDYNLDDIDSILDEIQLFDYNQPANDDSVEVAKSSISDNIQGNQSADNAAFQCANNGPDKSLEPEGDACILHNQDTPTSDKTIFQSARNTARELFDSLRASMSARRKRGITKRPASTSSSVDSSWRHSMGSAGSTSSGDLLDLSYESGEGDSESTGHTTPQPAFSLLPFDLISGEDLSSPGGSQDQSPSVLLQDEKDCDEVFGPPPPLPTSPPPSSSIKPCLPEDAESSVEPGEICFEDSDEYEPGEVHYSGSSGVNTICIGYNTEEFISKMLEEDYAPEEVRKDAITPSLFDLAEARGVYQKAVGLCNK